MCVLLVEDEWLTLFAAQTSLEAVGLTVLTAEHGDEAIRHIDERPGHFTCLVTDFHLQGGPTGAHIIQYMRPHYPIVPMVITSALTHVVTEGWRLQHAVDLLTKPYDPADLSALVQRLLDR